MSDYYNEIGRRFEKEKKDLVPKRDYLDGHPLEDKIRRILFKAGLKHQGHDAVKQFNSQIQTAIRTITSKTYFDVFKVVRHTSNEILSGDEVEQHLDYIFAELEKYQQDAKALVSKHIKELQSL